MTGTLTRGGNLDPDTEGWMPRAGRPVGRQPRGEGGRDGVVLPQATEPGRQRRVWRQHNAVSTCISDGWAPEL